MLYHIPMSKDLIDIQIKTLRRANQDPLGAADKCEGAAQQVHDRPIGTGNE